MRKHATTKTIERIANQYSDLYAVAKKAEKLPEKERKELLATNFANTKKHASEIGKIYARFFGAFAF